MNDHDALNGVRISSPIQKGFLCRASLESVRRRQTFVPTRKSELIGLEFSKKLVAASSAASHTFAAPPPPVLSLTIITHSIANDTFLIPCKLCFIESVVRHALSFMCCAGDASRSSGI